MACWLAAVSQLSSVQKRAVDVHWCLAFWLTCPVCVAPQFPCENDLPLSVSGGGRAPALSLWLSKGQPDSFASCPMLSPGDLMVLCLPLSFFKSKLSR